MIGTDLKATPDKVTIIALRGGPEACVSALASALARAGVEVETSFIEDFQLSDLNANILREARDRIAEARKNSFVIFMPNSTEIHLCDADLTIAFSAYNSWFDSRRMKIIPHLWTPVRSPPPANWPVWSAKPPLAIGFMGRSHATSRLTRIAGTAPAYIRRKILRGSYLKRPDLIAALNGFGLRTQNLTAFPRLEVMRELKKQSGKNDCVFEIRERSSFGGTPEEIGEYVSHLKANTYIICPRGSENYSYRMYEALCFGRVPVIIDADMVLPDEIDWRSLAIIVPYREMNTIVDRIRADYRMHSEKAFLARQQLALATMRQLAEMNWVDAWVRNYFGSRIPARELCARSEAR